MSEIINTYKDDDWQGQAVLQWPAGEPTPAAHKGSKSWIWGERLHPPPNWAEQCICSLWSSSWLYQRTFTESKTPHRLGPRHAWGISYSCINVLRFFFFFPTFCHKSRGKPQEKKLNIAILSLGLDPVLGFSAIILHFHAIHVAWMLCDMEKPSMSER